MKKGTRPMKIHCASCEKWAVRLLIRLDTGEDLPMCGFHTQVYGQAGSIGRPLPEVSDSADYLVTEYRESAGHTT